MNSMSKLGLSVAVGLLAAACSSSSPGSSSGTSGTTSGSGSGSASGAGTGTSAGASGGGSGTASGSSGAGTGATTSGTASGATSGAMSTEAGPEGSTTEEEGGTTEEAGGEAAAALPTVASVQALCTPQASSPYQAGTTAFTPSQFCVLFESICSGEIIAAAGYTSTESTCESVYGGVPASAAQCRTEHLCNANQMVSNEATHCPHTQGWGSLTTQAGSPCM
jgi:hypothetical protein